MDREWGCTQGSPEPLQHVRAQRRGSSQRLRDGVKVKVKSKLFSDIVVTQWCLGWVETPTVGNTSVMNKSLPTYLLLYSTILAM